MLTHPNPTVTDEGQAEVDTTPALRRLASRSINWWVAILLVCGPGSLLLGLLVLSPFLAVLAAAGLAGTCLRYVVRRDWGALAHISAGLGLVVVGYVTARAFHHAGLPTLATDRPAGDGNPNSGATFLANGRFLLVTCTYLLGVTVLLAGSAYALVRPYRTRFSRPVVLAACALLGAAIGLLG
jgi:hypothetical protein